MNRLRRVYFMAQALGWENLPRRGWQLLKGKLGISRRALPGGEIPDDALRAQFVSGYDPADAAAYWQARGERFFYRPSAREELTQALAATADDDVWAARVTRVADELARGRMSFFSNRDVEVGVPPRFNRDPVRGIDWPVGRHWSTYCQFDPALSDIKCIWEASRFGWAFHLARDYVRRADPAVADLFWRTFDAWDEQNPYGLTAQWACGQESTFRLLAWVFAAHALLDAPSTTALRLHRLTELVWYTGRHIAGNINYARGQKNNHAISEAVGLLTIGLLFPELTAGARWAARGYRVLDAELKRQIYQDGSYVQHSMNYHRVMLDDVLWAARLAELCGRPLPASALDQVRRALDWLLAMIEPASGRVPHYGPNDGALILPLSTCDYLDYRPVAQAVHYLLHREPVFAAGPWDEKALWLFGPGAVARRAAQPPRRESIRARSGGYFTFAGPQSWAFTRCHTYRDRPTDADMLHVDLWYGPENVLRDAGSYHYYCREPWQHYFHSTAAHNTIVIDDADQMHKGPRFLWLRWTRARVFAL